jgi:hypothetical protein
MTKQSGKRRYSSSNCIQDIFGFICNYVLSFSNPNQEYIVEVYIDHLQIDEPQETKPQIVDLVHTHTPVHIPYAPLKSLVRHEPRALFPTFSKLSDDYKPLTLPPIPAKIPDRYKPLDLPPILHDLHANYTNNVPRFDGENVRSLLKIISKVLRIFLICLRWKMMISALECLPYHCKLKLKFGLRVFQLQALAISINSPKFS